MISPSLSGATVFPRPPFLVSGHVGITRHLWPMTKRGRSSPFAVGMVICRHIAENLRNETRLWNDFAGIVKQSRKMCLTLGRSATVVHRENAHINGDVAFSCTQHVLWSPEIRRFRNMLVLIQFRMHCTTSAKPMIPRVLETFSIWTRFLAFGRELAYDGQSS